MPNCRSHDCNFRNPLPSLVKSRTCEDVSKSTHTEKLTLLISIPTVASTAHLQGKTEQMRHGSIAIDLVNSSVFPGKGRFRYRSIVRELRRSAGHLRHRSETSDHKRRAGRLALPPHVFSQAMKGRPQHTRIATIVITVFERQHVSVLRRPRRARISSSRRACARTGRH